MAEEEVKDSFGEIEGGVEAKNKMEVERDEEMNFEGSEGNEKGKGMMSSEGIDDIDSEMEIENTGDRKSSVFSTKSLESIDSETEIENIKKVEAALFVSGRYLTLSELVSLSDVNPILLRKILSDLKDKYSDSGIEITEQAGKWKMDVSSDYRDIVNRLATGESEFSNAEQETLAIIAYKQPMKQSVLIKIRGNKAYDHIKRFVELGLVNKKRIGHTAELTLSDSFHDYFHVGKGDDFKDALKIEEGIKVDYGDEDGEEQGENLTDENVEIRGGEEKKGESRGDGGEGKDYDDEEENSNERMEDREGKEK